MASYKPLRIEYARSDRSRCRDTLCSNIEYGDLRIGIKFPEFPYLKWFHCDCFFFGDGIMELTMQYGDEMLQLSVQELFEGLENLRTEDVDRTEVLHDMCIKNYGQTEDF